MDNILPLDGMARYRSFMAKTQLLETECELPKKPGASPWLRKRKVVNASKPHSPITALKHSHQSALLKTTRANLYIETIKPAIHKLQCSLSILPMKFCQDLAISQDKKGSPVLPIKQKVRLYSKNSTEQLPSLVNLRRTIIHEFKDGVKQKSKSKKPKLLTKPESTTLTPRLKYQKSQHSNNVSQLNRLVTQEVFYKLSRSRNQTEI